MSTSGTNKLKGFSPRLYSREILAVLMLLLAIVFFRSERKELASIIPQLGKANPFWLAIALLISVINTFCQGGIYRQSFAAIGLRLQWVNAVVLFLKRNFISVFLPAGGVSALAYSPSQIRKLSFSKMQVHQASGLFGFAGLLTVFLAGLPVIIFTLYAGANFQNSWIGLFMLSLVIVMLFLVVRSLKQKKMVYRWIDKKFPSVTPTINELFAANVNRKKFAGAIGYSMGVELTGMLHVMVCMLALGFAASAGASAAAYIIAILMMVISPFLRGLGAVELSMVYVLQQFGYTSAQALSVTILFRIFEFWVPLVAGLLSFAWKGRKIFLRVAPALVIFSLGIVNIISAVTPPVVTRLKLVREYLPIEAIHTSHLLILFIGLSLLVTAGFLFSGLRNAWIIAMSLSLFSLVGHLTKALDYEEATFAGITCIVLFATASQYRIRSSNKWMQAGVKIAGLSFAAVLLFGFVSFYFIDVKHFGINFTWRESLWHTIQAFLLVEDTGLNPVTRFGNEFVWLIRSLGFLTWGFLLFTLIKPHFRKQTVNENYRERAAFLLQQFGSSAVDYFKLYKDKLLFFSDIHESFVSYRISGGFAIVLDEPVCAEENKMEVITEFDRHCRKMGLKPAFYRVDENSIPWFNELRKQNFIIGQEAILEVTGFTLEGKDKKSLRNGLNAIQNKGFSTATHEPPYSREFILQLRAVSDEWLQSFRKEELVFSQGMFDEEELQLQDIITLSDADGKLVAFLNIIPDFAENECTYDLIRKSTDAPGAAMDALIVKMIEYARSKNKLYLNMGMVPMTGIVEPENTAEQIIKLAADKIKRFQHYKGLRAFKEKYATFWENKYIVYNDDFELLQLPLALNTVMKP
jgi:phosphatidylglycerol lysyltransferase